MADQKAIKQSNSENSFLLRFINVTVLNLIQRCNDCKPLNHIKLMLYCGRLCKINKYLWLSRKQMLNRFVQKVVIYTSTAYHVTHIISPCDPSPIVKSGGLCLIRLGTVSSFKARNVHSQHCLLQCFTVKVATLT